MTLIKTISCGNCGNISSMEEVGRFEDCEEEFDEDGQPWGYSGTIYIGARCPACKVLNIVSHDWADWLDSDEFINYEVLHPKQAKYPLGLPEEILRTYKAAEKIKSDDPGSYAMLLRRLLELVCKNRNAEGNNLQSKLKDLADKNEIPEKLASIAQNLRMFGNIGAHPYAGDLKEREIPIVSALANAILEYIYSAPYLANIAEKRLKIYNRKK